MKKPWTSSCMKARAFGPGFFPFNLLVGGVLCSIAIRQPCLVAIRKAGLVGMKKPWNSSYEEALE